MMKDWYNNMVKKISAEDFSTLEQLIKEQQLFHYNLDTSNNERFLKIGVKEFTEYMEEETDYICLAAYDSKEATGFIACTISDSTEAFIEDIFVKKEHRYNGVGNKLMNSLLELLKSKNSITIKVHITRNNEGVFPFYEKYGFLLESNDDTGYIMCKNNDSLCKGVNP